MVPLQQAVSLLSLSIHVDSGDNKHMCACDDFDHQPGASWRRGQDTSSFQPWRSEMAAFMASMLEQTSNSSKDRSLAEIRT